MSAFPASASIVVGEAPESDDDDNDEVVEEPDETRLDDVKRAAPEANASASSATSHQEASSTAVASQTAARSAAAAAAAVDSKRRAAAYQQNSLLHAKFFQDAAQLQTALVGRRAATYETATRGVRQVTGQLAKTHAYIQEVSHALRLTTNDLYKLEDRLRSVQHTDWLAGL